jgi:hypothetical protein
MSRIYGGIHFHFSHLAGVAAGRGAGEYVFDNYFQPSSGIAASVSSR